MSKQAKSFFFLIFNFIIILTCNAQETKPKFYFGGINFNTGRIVPHSKRIEYITGSVFALQGKLYQNLISKKDWENPFKATKFGYSLTYIHTENSIIGDFWGVNMFIEPMLFDIRRFKLYMHMGAGFAYATEKFDKISNPANFMISTDISYFFNLKLNFDYQLSKQFSAGLNVGFSHCSNGALNLPNLGINILNYGVNFAYRIFEENYKHEKQLTISNGKKWAVDYALGFATRNVNEELNKYYLILTGDFAINRFINRKNILSFNFHYILRQGEINDKIYSNNYNSYYGLALGHELLIRKLSLITQLGAYIYDTNLNLHYWYAHLGIRYYLTKNLFAMITLSNQKQSADYIQYAIGYRFR